MEISGYQVFNRVGAGATSEVFRAKCLDYDREVALKCFSQIVCTDEDMLRRLELEAVTLEALNDPNIVKLYRSFHDGNHWGLELEYIDGNSLDEWRQLNKSELIQPKLYILTEILKGLSSAHLKGIIHRDLKPENILISNTGDVKLTDFGLAKTLTSATITKSGLLIGSLAYMPPEVLDLSQANKKSDIYSFGVIAYELLAGKLPFESQSPQALIREITSEQARDLNLVAPLISKKISNIVMSCLAKNPKDRPESTFHIYAEIMSELAESSIASYVKELVKIPFETTLYSQALTDYYQEIEGEVKDLEKLEDALFIHAKLKALYNQSQLIHKVESFILGLKNQKERNRRPFYFVILFISLIYTAGFIFMQGQPSPTKEQLAAVPKLTPAIPLKVKPKQIITKKKIAKKKVTSPAAVVEFGFINFEIPKDISVFVDGIAVPKASLNKYKLRPGEHNVRFVKKGFDPISGKVFVTVNKTSIVRIGEGQ